MSELPKDPLNNKPEEELEAADKPIEESGFEEERAYDEESEREVTNTLETAAAAESVVPAAHAAVQPAKQMKAWPWMALAVIAIIALIVVLVRESGGGSMNAAVGEVDGQEITKAELYDELQKSMGDSQLGSSLDQLLMFKVIGIEAEKTGKTVSDADVDAYIDNVKKQNGFDTDEAFSQALASSSMTLDSFKEQIRPQLELRLIFDKKLAPTEDQLKDYYEKNKDSFATTPEQVTASDIILSSKADAEAVLQQLKQGADFATVAKEKSLDTNTKDNGGSMGSIGKGQLGDQTLEDAVFKLKKGELSGVIEASDGGFYIVKVSEHTEAVIPTYDEAKQDVKDHYLDDQINSGFSDWYTAAKKELGYKNYLTKEDATTAEESPAPSASASAEPSASASPSPSASASANP